MRFGRTFLALTGLCGVALTCLISLADEPAEEIPYPSAPPAEVAEHYSRSPEPARPNVIEFGGDFLGSKTPAPEPPSSFDPVVPVGAPPQPAETADVFDNAEYGEDAPSEEFNPFHVSPPPQPMKPELENLENIAIPELPMEPPKRGGVTILNTPVRMPAAPAALEPPAVSPVPVSDPVALPAVPVMPPTAAPAPVAPTVNAAAPPANGPEVSQVSLEWVKRSEINVGQECQCDLLVKNTGDAAVRDVSVIAVFPAAARLLPTTKPAPTPNGKQLVWALGELGPGQSQVISVHLIPTSRKDMNAFASVQYSAVANTVFKVQEPLLEVVLKGPKEIQVGDPASQIIQVSNPGTGTARNVEVKAHIPPGLEHPQGKQLALSIGSLNAGETRMIRLALAAVSGGTHQIKVLAEAKFAPEQAPYLRKLVETDIRVISPSVQVAVNGPSLRYKNRNATYNITVANDGTAVSNNIRVMHKVPEGFRFVSATDGGKFDGLSKTVAWFAGRVEPGQSTKVAVTLEAVKLGDYVHQVSATTDQGIRSEGEAATKVDGIAALVLEVKDLDDPVEVGVETAYEIHVKNQGTKHAQNVAVACELPAGLELVGVNSAVKHNLQGRILVFQALPMLDAEKSAVYRVIVRGQGDGYQRFRARLSSDSIQEPLLVEELTRFYGE